MSEIIESIEYKGYTINIKFDDMAEDPRKNFDPMGHMICWHRRYNLGDKHSYNDIEELMEELGESALVKPLYLYDHSGITMSTGAFGCPWDSGQVGVIYMTEAEIIKEYGDNSEDSRQRADMYLEGEVQEYDNYLTGQVYGYEIEETGDSTWGYYGWYHKSGIIEDAKAAIDWQIKHNIKKHLQQLKQWIKAKVPVIYRKPMELV